MKIEFAPGIAGFHEARELSAIVRYIVDQTVTGSHDIQLLDAIEQSATEHMSRTEFAAIRGDAATSIDDRPLSGRLADYWRSIWGPSRREVSLSKQRVEALARAERAERSSFEALAEMARVARERDEAQARLKEIKARVDKLYEERTGGSKPEES